MTDETDRDEEVEEQEEEIASTPQRRTTKTSKKPSSPLGVGGNAGNMVGRARTKEDGTPNSKWQSHEAELMWPEILRYLEGVGKSPYDVEAQIVRVDPPGPTGAVGMGAAIDGQALMGDTHVSPSERLMTIVTDTKHMPTARGPARYEVRFTWKLGAGRIGTGILNLPSPAEIMALRNAAMQQQYEASQQQPQQMPHGAGAPPRAPMQPPQQPQWPQNNNLPPWAYYGPPPYGYSQPFYGQQQQGLSPEMSAMQAELAATRGALNEALAAAREGRQPRLEGVAAPPPSEEAIAAKVTERVLMALRAAGIGGQPAQVAAPAQQVPPPATDQRIKGVLDGIIDAALGEFSNRMRQSVKQVMGVGGVPEDAATAEVVAPDPPAEPYAAPFDVAPVSDVKWPDGSPVRYAADRETGDISPMGLAMSNPYVAEKVMGIANRVTEGLTDALKGLARGQTKLGEPQRQPPAQVVREIPQGAKDATPANGGENGGGWPQV